MLVVKELLVDVVLLYSAETVVLVDGVLLDRAEEEFQCYRRRSQRWHCFERQRLEFPIVHKLNKCLPVSTTSVACVTLR